MSQEALRRWRTFVPGVLIVIAVTLFVVNVRSLADILKRNPWLGNGWFLAVAVPAIAYVLGTLYYTLRLRKPVWNRFLGQIDDHIKTSLLRLCDEDPVISAGQVQLRQGKGLLDVFWRVVDSDESLLERAKRVRFNGLVATSFADVVTVGTVAVVAYVAAFGITQRFTYLLTAGIGAVLVLVAYFVLLPLVTRHHIELTEDQLRLLQRYYRQQVCADIRERADAL
jgi:hypothetical protein